jgi:L-histidine N-alpha-methyltransferase
MEPILDATAGPVTIEVHLDGDPASDGLAETVREGLARPFKELPPKYFYDERGSRLFEQITELPEYYPTRAERSILELQSGAIAAAVQASELIELGSGSASKTRHLIGAMRERGELERYIPVDISEEITRATAEALAAEYPGLRVHGVVCDFERHLELLPPGERRLIAFLGGTIGNFFPAERLEFLSRLASLMGPGDALLLGTDLVKDHARLEAAYDDSQGVTAEFNKNVLHVLNRELGADFDVDAFQHRAFYDAENAWVDIRLRSLRDQRVALSGLGMEVDFAAGEEMRTEISSKFTRRALERAYAAAGLKLAGWFTDSGGLFALSLARIAD